MAMRKKLKAEVARQAEAYAIAVAKCYLHGNGDDDCLCGSRTESYAALVDLLRSTDSKLPKSEKSAARRKQTAREIKLTVMPHYVNDDLLECLAPALKEMHALGHESPDVVFDDGCCAAVYCEDCGRWGHVVSNYAIDDEIIFPGEEKGGPILTDECSVPYEGGVADALTAVTRRNNER